LKGNIAGEDKALNFSIKEMTDTVMQTYEDSDMTEIESRGMLDTPAEDYTTVEPEVDLKEQKHIEEQLHYENYVKPLAELNANSGMSLAQMFNQRKKTMKSRLENAKASKTRIKDAISSRFSKIEYPKSRSVSKPKQKPKKSSKPHVLSKSKSKSQKKSRSNFRPLTHNRTFSKSKSRSRNRTSNLNSRTDGLSLSKSASKMNNTALRLMDRLIKPDSSNQGTSELPQIRALLEGKIKQKRLAQM
jgi:hypothetical protein